MFVFHDDAGLLLFTVNGDEAPDGIAGQSLQIPDQDLGDLTTWRVVDGQLTLWDIEPYVRTFRDAVNAHRNLIILAGVRVEITGHGPISLQGRPEDQASLQGLAFGAQLRLAMGDTKTKMHFLDRDNVLHELLPMQMLELWQKGAGFVSGVYARSWLIKDMDPFTTDPADPELWK